MAYVSTIGLEWALDTLLSWAHEVPVRRGQKNFFRFLLLKEFGVNTGSVTTALSTTDFRECTKRLLQVTFEDDPSSARTNGQAFYFSPFDFDYKKARGSSDLAVGTLWTRCQTWRSNNILEFPENDGPRHIQFAPNYISGIREEMGEKKVPLAASLLFLFRRPSDSGVDLAGVANVSDAVTLGKAHFHLDPTELAQLFDANIPPTDSGFFQEHELSRDQVLDLLQSRSPSPTTISSSGAPPSVASTSAADWSVSSDTVANSIDLVGHEKCIEQALAALRANLHVILLGAPGTGKTTIAEAIAKAVCGPGQYIMATATADWTTYETMGGYMPAPSGGGTSLEYSRGIVIDAIYQKKWLILDELNRADIDKAFGELFTLLSGQTVQLPYRHTPGGERVVLSPNPVSPAPAHVIELDKGWRVVGTMNTFDKASLFQLSYAFMRRFAFVEVPIPTSVQYKQIIEASFADLRGDHSVPVGGDWDQHLVTAEKLFVALFAQDSGGLAAIDANVGPAIPRTMLRYIIERCSQFNAPPLLSVQELFLEAASTCLFPQYEGRRTEHARIVDAVVGVLPQESQRENESNVSKALSIWTGHKD